MVLVVASAWLGVGVHTAGAQVTQVNGTVKLQQADGDTAVLQVLLSASLVGTRRSQLFSFAFQIPFDVPPTLLPTVLSAFPDINVSQ